MQKILITLSFLILLSCAGGEDKKNLSGENPIARVYEKKLYLSELAPNIPRQLNKKDSLLFLDTYREQWILNELLLHQAESNLSEDQKDIEKEISEYRKNLLVYRYETELVKQKLDTAVSQQEIE